MDGLFELLIIAAIFLFPALEAWAKKRQRERAGRTGGEAGGDAGEGWPSGEDEPGPAGPVGADAREPRPDESAEVLLPEDLWEELTGQKRSREQDAGPAPSDVESAGTGTAARKADDWSAPERELESASRPTADAGTWKGWQEGGEGSPTPEGMPSSAAGDGGGREAGEPPPEGLGREVGGFPEPDEPRRADVLDEIGAGGPRGAGHRRTADLGRLRPGRMARRGGPPAHARELHPLVGDLDRQALRRAVVWSEILGPPVSMRKDG